MTDRRINSRDTPPKETGTPSAENLLRNERELGTPDSRNLSGTNPTPTDASSSAGRSTVGGTEVRPGSTPLAERQGLGQASLDRLQDGGAGEKRPLVNDVVQGRPESTRAANNLATEHMHLSTPTGVAKPVTVELRDGGGTQNMTRIKAEDGRTVLYTRPDGQGGEQFFRQDGNRLVQTDKQGQKVENGETLNVRNIQVGRTFDAPATPAATRPNQPANPAGPVEQTPGRRPSPPADVTNPHRSIPAPPAEQPPVRRTNQPGEQPSTPAGGPRRLQSVDGDLPSSKPAQGRDRPGGPNGPQGDPTVRGRTGDGPGGQGPGIGPGQRGGPQVDGPGRAPQDQTTGRGPNRQTDGPTTPGTGPGGPTRRDVQDQPSPRGQNQPGERGPGDRSPVVPIPVPGREGRGPEGPGSGGGGPAGRGGADGERGGKPGDKADVGIRGDRGDRGVGGGGIRVDGILDRLPEGKPGAKPLDPRLVDLMSDPKLQVKLMDIFQRALSGDRELLNPRFREVFKGLDERQITQLQRGLLDGLKNPLTLDRLDPMLQGKLRDLADILGGKQLATGRLIDGMVRDGMLAPGRDTLTTVIRDMDRTSKLFESGERGSRELMAEMIGRGLDRNGQFLIGTESSASRTFVLRLDADEPTMKALVDRLQSDVLRPGQTETSKGASVARLLEEAKNYEDGGDDSSLSARLFDDGGDDGVKATTVESRLTTLAAKELAVGLAKPGDPVLPPKIEIGRTPEGVRPADVPTVATSIPSSEMQSAPQTFDNGPEGPKGKEEKRPEEKPERTGPTPEEIAALAQKKLDEERKRKEREEETRRLDQERRDKEKKNKRGSYRVRHGDTLISIAQSQCNDGNLAALIFDINKGRIAEKFIGARRCAVLKVNQTLTTPSENDITNFKRWGGRSSSLDFNHPAGAPDIVATPEGGFASPEAELAAKFGMAWGATGKSGKSRFDDGKEVKGSRTDDVKAKIRQNRHHIEAALGPLRKDPPPPENRIKYVCRIGDTLRSVALRHASMQDVKLWELIAIINDLPTEQTAKGEPAAKLTRGQTLLLPAPEEIQSWRAGTYKREATFELHAAGGYVEMARRICPHCERPTLISALICPGCSRDMDSDADDYSESEQVESSVDNTGTAYGDASLPASDVESAAESDIDAMLPVGYDTMHELPALVHESESLQQDDQVATSDEIAGYYKVIEGGMLLEPAEQVAEIDVAATIDIDVESSKALQESLSSSIERQPQDSTIVSGLIRVPPVVETGSPLPVERTEAAEPFYLAVNARLLRQGSPDDLVAGYRMILEGQFEKNWIPVASYEFYEDVILHHAADHSGKKRTRRISLPIRQALQLAENDLSTNWYQYFRSYSTTV